MEEILNSGNCYNIGAWDRESDLIFDRPIKKLILITTDGDFKRVTFPSIYGYPIKFSNTGKVLLALAQIVVVEEYGNKANENYFVFKYIPQE